MKSPGSAQFLLKSCRQDQNYSVGSGGAYCENFNLTWLNKLKENIVVKNSKQYFRTAAM
jgi:hypothetical protein